jgi:2-oxoisovalerate dehydrogenase E1 component beta subunit
VRQGGDVTLVTYGATVHVAEEAAETAGREGIHVEVIDLRTLWPLDIETVIQSVEKTGRAIVLHEAPRTCGFGAELAALIQEKAFLHLESPVSRVTGFDTPFPYALEKIYIPDADRTLKAIVAAASF